MPDAAALAAAALAAAALAAAAAQEPVEYGEPTTACENSEEAAKKPMAETECRAFFHAYHHYALDNGNPVLPDGHRFYRTVGDEAVLTGSCACSRRPRTRS